MCLGPKRGQIFQQEFHLHCKGSIDSGLLLGLIIVRDTSENVPPVIVVVETPYIHAWQVFKWHRLDKLSSWLAINSGSIQDWLRLPAKVSILMSKDLMLQGKFLTL